MLASRILGCLVAAVLPLAAAPEGFKWVSVQGGGTFFGDSAYRTRPHYGLGAGWWLSERWGAELRATRGGVVDRTGQVVAYEGIGSLTALWRIWPGEFRWQPYLAAGLGSTRNPAYGTSASGPFHSLGTLPEVHGGAGIYRRIGERGLLSFDYRLVHTGLRGTQYDDYLVSMGVGFTFGEGRAQAPQAPAPPRVLPPPPAPPPQAAPAPAPAPLPAPAAAVAAPAPRPAPRRKVLLKGARVRFANGQAVLDRHGSAALDQVAASLKGHEGLYRVKVTGHASKVGPKALNQRLSLKRAEVVAEHLREEGVPATALQVEARGTSEPHADDRTRRGRALNRRAEVAVKGDPDAVEVLILDTAPVSRKVAKQASAKAGRHPAAKASKHKGKAGIRRSRGKARK